MKRFPKIILVYFLSYFLVFLLSIRIYMITNVSSQSILPVSDFESERK
jgi:hypothetical protein